MKTEHTPTPENTGKHTPTPWRLHERAYLNICSGERSIANCGTYTSNVNAVDIEEESLANAQLIVTAVNSYSTLKAENERLKNDLEEANIFLKIAVPKIEYNRIKADNEAKEKRIKELEKHLSIMIDLTVAYANKLNISGDYIDQVIHAREALKQATE